LSEKIILLNPAKCTGCRRCELACSFSKEKIFNPAQSRIRLLRIKETEKTVPVVCQQCTTPLCTYVCPTKAITKDEETGLVTINPDICVGCMMCFVACPVGGISINPKTKMPIKCDLCEGDPACVRECEYGALEFIELDDANAIKRREAIKKLPEILEMIG
jgi:Fe-S-cluster-containing hydrogenase component 2